MKPSLNAFQLKVIAVLAMTVDHVAWLFVPFEIYPTQSFIMHCIGKITFPIMAFLITEGYRKTSDVKRYVLRLLVWGVIAQAPFYLAFRSLMYINVLITLMLGVVALWALDRAKPRWLGYAVCVGCFAASSICDWNNMGFVMILMFGLIRHPKARVLLSCITVPLIQALYTLFLLSQPGAYPGLWLNVTLAATVLPALLLLMYNGERGKRPMKYFFYAYYPAHLLVLGLLKVIM